MPRPRAGLLLPLFLFLQGCGGGDPLPSPGGGAGEPGSPGAAEFGLPWTGLSSPPDPLLSLDRYREDLRTLSSDAFEGRAPSSPGEERTVAYLIEAFQAAGLEPGNRGSWTQEVPLVALRVRGAPAMTMTRAGSTRELAYGVDQVAWTTRVVEEEGVEGSELVFVGYGVVAPEYDWDDYAGVDMAGKTALILVNDPGYALGGPELFRGEAMTYYGRWTYKFEEAARQGAAGALIIHETGPAGYPWEVVTGSWTGPQFDLVAEDNNMSRLQVEGWLTTEAARTVLAEAGEELEELRVRALSGDFRPLPLGTELSLRLQNEIRRSTSNNVVARLAGRERPDEVVVYMAHWDHLGRTPDFVDDGIFNGAVDNASGTAALLELARAFAALEPAPARSVLFLGVTAEEQGLLGSAWYAANPAFPRTRTVAAINMDGMNVDGPMRDITVVGYGNSELDDLVERVAEEAGRRVREDPEPEKGFFYRSDHFSFAREGIPALYTNPGIDHVEHGEAWTLARRADYTANRYHKPADEFDPGWDLSGALDDMVLLFRVGWLLAESGSWPEWREGNEFRAVREAEMGGGAPGR